MQNDHRIIPVIAIDGTAASGKGTLAKRLAAHFDFGYLDTGLLYRRVALDLMNQDQSWEDEPAATQAALRMDPAQLDDPRLRGAEAGRGASVVAAIPAVRAALLEFQRNFPSRCGKAGAILDGRDIGTAIFPDAAVKFYIDAGLEARAKRRHAELAAAGDPITLDTVIADFKIRDARDSNRATNPMKAAADAAVIDTTNLNADETFALALSILESKGF
jgi:cytidylate kinase